MVDTDTMEVKWLDLLGKGKSGQRFHGDYELQKTYKDTLVIKFSAMDTPTQIYGVTFKSTTSASLTELIGEGNLTVKLIEGI